MNFDIIVINIKNNWKNQELIITLSITLYTSRSIVNQIE